MRKNKLTTIKKGNPYLRKNIFDLGGYTPNLSQINTLDLGTIPTLEVEPQKKGVMESVRRTAAKTGQFLKNNPAVVSGLGAAVGKGISGGLETGVGNAMQGLGNIASAIPGPYGAIASAALNVTGGLVNKAFGSKLNEAKIAEVNQNINQVNANSGLDAGDYDALADKMSTMTDTARFSKSDIGKDGWFSSKAKKKYESLKAQADIANARQSLSTSLNADMIAENTMQNLQQNYIAEGGSLSRGNLDLGIANRVYANHVAPAYRPAVFEQGLPVINLPYIGTYANGGNIHIKPENRGKFTEAANRAGMEVQEYARHVLANKDNYSPTLVKRANFVRNAASWKHAEGGSTKWHDYTYTDALDHYASMGLSKTNQNYLKQIIKKLDNTDLTDAAKKALLQAMYVESSFNPRAVNSDSGATGLLQWLDNRRPANWQNTVDYQLDYLLNDLTSNNGLMSGAVPRDDIRGSRAMAQQFKYAQDPEYAAFLLGTGYQRNGKTKEIARANGQAFALTGQYTSNPSYDRDSYISTFNDLFAHNYLRNIAIANYNNGLVDDVEQHYQAMLNDPYDYTAYAANTPIDDLIYEGHWPDTYKLPSHPTFSDEFVYSGVPSEKNPYGEVGGHWEEDLFLPVSTTSTKQPGVWVDDLGVVGGEYMRPINTTSYAPVNVSYANGGILSVEPLNRYGGNDYYEWEPGPNDVLALKQLPIINRYKNKGLNVEPYAFGGELNTAGANFNNGLLQINEGGTHEQNSLDGVPMGFDSQGTPNAVEEGETIFNDYVFSNRLSPKEDYKKKYKLGGNMTFADASKKLAKESEERPNDPISTRGMQAFMNELQSAQEEVKMEKAMREQQDLMNQGIFANVSPQPSMMDTGNWYDAGGDLDKDEEYKYKEVALDSNYDLSYFNTMIEKYLNADEIALAKEKGYLDKLLTDYIIKDKEFIPQAHIIESIKLDYTFRVHSIQRQAICDYLRDHPNNLKYAPKNLKKYIEQPDKYKILNMTQRKLIEYAQRHLQLENGGYVGQIVKNRNSNLQMVRINDTQFRDPGTNKLWTKTNTASSTAPSTTSTTTSNTTLDTSSTAPSTTAHNPTPTFVNHPVAGSESAVSEETFTTESGSVTPATYYRIKGNDTLFTPEQYNQIAGDYQLLPYGVTEEDTDENGNPISILNYKAVENTTPEQLPTWMQYAPIVGAGMLSLTDALELTNKPRYTEADAALSVAKGIQPTPISYTPIGDYMTYKPIDRNYYVNTALGQANATRRALLSNAGLTRGSAAASLVANNNSTITGLGDLFKQAEDTNWTRRKDVADFNRETHKFNSQQALNAAQANQNNKLSAATNYADAVQKAMTMRRSAWEYSDKAKSSNLSQFLTSLYNLGTQNMYQNQLRNLYNNNTQDIEVDFTPYNVNNSDEVSGGGGRQ